jgi:glycosyltransferase involved in cell wall biosynthesis
MSSEREALVLNTPIPNIPLVSIIVPLYNHARYVEATLESFRTEGYPALEVVIIDDGSTDDSFEVARDWLKAHPNAFKNVVLERQENQGITKTLNRLVSLSHGAFIAIVASDDLLLPGGIQARLEALQARPDWLAVFGDANVINAQGQTIKPSALQMLSWPSRVNKNALLDDARRNAELILRWCVPGPVLLAKRETFDPEKGIGGYEEAIFLEDRHFYLRLMSRHALGFVDRPVAAYRVHHASLTGQREKHIALWGAVHSSEVANVERFGGEDRVALELAAERSEWFVRHLTWPIYKRPYSWFKLTRIRFTTERRLRRAERESGQ